MRLAGKHAARLTKTLTYQINCTGNHKNSNVHLRGAREEETTGPPGWYGFYATWRLWSAAIKSFMAFSSNRSGNSNTQALAAPFQGDPFPSFTSTISQHHPFLQTFCQRPDSVSNVGAEVDILPKSRKLSLISFFPAIISIVLKSFCSVFFQG